MNCLELREILSLYADGVLNEAENAACEKHLAECPLCRQELDNILQISRLLQEMPEIPLPENFQQELHQKLLKEAHLDFNTSNAVPLSIPKKKKKPSYRWLGGVLAASLLLAIGIGSMAINADLPGTDAVANNSVETARATQMSAETADETVSGYSAAATPETAAALPDTNAVYGEGSASIVTQEGSQKIIYHTQLMLDVDQIEPKIEEATTIAEKYGGYVLTSSVSQNEAGEEQLGTMTIRIPLEQYEAAVADFSALGTLRENYKSGNDVTTEYYDIQARLTQYRSQEERYLELLEQATTVSEIMEVEAQLNEVRLNIESLEAQLDTLTRLTDYGTIDINFSVSTVKKEGVSFRSWSDIGSRLGQALTASINAMIYGFSRLLIFLVYILPILLVLGVLIVVIVLIIRHKKKKKE